ncbi:MAG: DinB family protein [Planctomycetota bacterium]
MLDIEAARDQLRASADAIQSIVSRMTDEEAAYKPSPERWSVHEVLCHLLHEETLDFRRRLDLTLHHPEMEWPGIDPEATVREETHTLSWRDTLTAFLAARVESLEWLGSVSQPNLEQAHTHPRFGAMAAATLLHSWVGHDLLHLRQILRLSWDQLTERAQPHTTMYAGDW